MLHSTTVLIFKNTTRFYRRKGKTNFALVPARFLFLNKISFQLLFRTIALFIKVDHHTLNITDAFKIMIAVKRNGNVAMFNSFFLQYLYSYMMVSYEVIFLVVI